jgi:hypothetical protein
MNDFASYMHDPKNFEHKNYQKYDPKQFWEVSQERKKKLGDNYGGPPVKADLPPSLAYCSWTETVLIDKIRDKIQMKTVDDGRGQHNSFRLFDVHGQGIIKRNTLQTRLEEVGYLWVYLCPLCRAMSSARRLCSPAAAAAAAAAAAPPPPPCPPCPSCPSTCSPCLALLWRSTQPLPCTPYSPPPFPFRSFPLPFAPFRSLSL